jgi:hypothetical protein
VVVAFAAAFAVGGGLGIATSRSPLSGSGASSPGRCYARQLPLPLRLRLRLRLSLEVYETGTETGAGAAGLVLHLGSEKCDGSLDRGGRISGIASIGGPPRRTGLSVVDKIVGVETPTLMRLSRHRAQPVLWGTPTMVSYSPAS